MTFGKPFEPGREKTGGRKLGVRNKLSERFLKDLHDKWERSGQDTLKILAKENPEAFARLAVGILPREFEGLPPAVQIITGVVRGDEGPAVALRNTTFYKVGHHAARLTRKLWCMRITGNRSAR
jgi:hypothetical protein